MNGQKLEALRDRIFAALGRGAAREARRGIEKLRRYEPAEAASLLTALCIEERDAKGALKAWQECRARAPHEPYTIFLRARIHLLMGERRAALRVLTPLFDAPMSAEVAEKVYNLAGQCARFLGAADKAVGFYARARDAAPNLALRALNASNVLFNRHYLPAAPAEDRQAAEEYGRLFAAIQALDHRAHR